MIRHCVFIRFKGSVTAAQRDALFKEIAVLQSHLAGIVAVHLGHNVSTETGMDKGYGDGFMVDFTGADARDAYLIDEEHQRAGAKLVEAAEGGVAGILVYDMDIAAAEQTPLQRF